MNIKDDTKRVFLLVVAIVMWLFISESCIRFGVAAGVKDAMQDSKIVCGNQTEEKR